MRNLQLFIAALAAALALPVHAAPAAGSTHSATRLRGGDCLDPTIARGFTSLDDRHLLVDGGRNRYRIEISQACWNLNVANVIGFRGDPVSNRVCGSAFDAVLMRGEPPCRIERMELLSKEEYAAALRDREAWRRARRAEREAAKQR